MRVRKRMQVKAGAAIYGHTDEKERASSSASLKKGQRLVEEKDSDTITS